MVRVLLRALRAAGSCGAFVQMHAGNVRAMRFYGKLGFTVLHGVGGDSPCSAGGAPSSGDALYMGTKL